MTIAQISRMRLGVLGALGRVSMYRLVLGTLAALTLIAVVLGFLGLILPSGVELLVTATVLVVVGSVIDIVGHRVIRTPWRPESTLITAGILLFVVWPGAQLPDIIGAAVAAAAASLSKFLIVWRGRHIFNPAAFGAAVATLSTLGFSAWWVGTPWLFVPVLIAGIIVLWRTDKIAVVAVFAAVAIAVNVVRVILQLNANGETMALEQLIMLVVVQSPILFLGAFMLSEPLTLPPRRWQQMVVAVVVGVLVGAPIVIGAFTIGADRALLVGNLIGFLLAVRQGTKLRVESRRAITPTAIEVTFTAARPLSFLPGQYLEVEVPHAKADGRGTRREFSIVSSPKELPSVTIAYRDRQDGARSSFKRALAEVPVGAEIATTGVWGDFVSSRRSHPLLFVAAGIGVTPFVSHLRAMTPQRQRDVVVAFVAREASELAYLLEFGTYPVRGVVFTPDEPLVLPDGWAWAEGERLTAETLGRFVPDLAERRAYISGPPALIGSLRPALKRARGVHTDAFAGA